MAVGGGDVILCGQIIRHDCAQREVGAVVERTIKYARSGQTMSTETAPTVTTSEDGAPLPEARGAGDADRKGDDAQHEVRVRVEPREAFATAASVAVEASIQNNRKAQSTPTPSVHQEKMIGTVLARVR